MIVHPSFVHVLAHCLFFSIKMLLPCPVAHVIPRAEVGACLCPAPATHAEQAACIERAKWGPFPSMLFTFSPLHDVVCQIYQITGGGNRNL